MAAVFDITGLVVIVLKVVDGLVRLVEITEVVRGAEELSDEVLVGTRKLQAPRGN